MKTVIHKHSSGVQETFVHCLINWCSLLLLCWGRCLMESVYSVFFPSGAEGSWEGAWNPRGLHIPLLHWHLPGCPPFCPSCSYCVLFTVNPHSPHLPQTLSHWGQGQRHCWGLSTWKGGYNSSHHRRHQPVQNKQGTGALSQGQF